MRGGFPTGACKIAAHPTGARKRYHNSPTTHVKDYGEEDLVLRATSARPTGAASVVR
jgi:hypothetical protein